MDYEVLNLERREHVAIITLNRPEIMNALSPQLTAEFHRVLDEVGGEKDIRAIVITGNGRGFCSGADVTSWAEARADGQRAPAVSDDPRGIVELAPHMRKIPQPVIAAVNGVAAGAGLGVALAADFRIGSEHARFSSIFVKRSLVPDTAASYTLPKLVGHGVAAEMALTGNIYDAQWALEKGLVNRIVPANELLDTAISLANDIANNPPIVVRSIKRLIDSWYEDLDDVIIRERVGNGDATGSEDKTEAVRAFIEKRKPVFQGR